MTVLEVIQKSADFLAGRGVESPRLQTELLLAHVLGLPRMQLYLNFTRELAPAELDALRELVRRRGRREPLQHIVGSVSFCGLDLAVNRHVLVPRPETEMLAELGWQFLAESTTSDPGSPAVLDFGTGSGCIAIALAVHSPNARITALDVSANVLVVARQNALRHGVDNRIQFLQSDGFTAVSEGSAFNLLVSNPPYIPTGEIALLQPEVRDHDPRAALDGGADGLDFFRRLASQGRAQLRPAGRILVELGDGQADAAQEIFTSQKWIVEALKNDYTRRPRFLMGRLGR